MILTPRELEEGQPEKYERLRAAGLEMVKVILETTPSSANQTAAIRKVREAVMTANAADYLPPPNRIPSDSSQTASGRRSGATALLDGVLTCCFFLPCCGFVCFRIALFL